MRKQVLGVNVDFVSASEAVEVVESWMHAKKRHYIVTPNPEMIVDARQDKVFMKALNQADLAIADSPRLGWASKLGDQRLSFFRFFQFWTFLNPKSFQKNAYPSTTGIDLMERLLALSEEKGYRTAFLGGSDDVAVELSECLKRRYKKLKIIFCSGNVKVDKNGVSHFDIYSTKKTMSNNIKSDHQSVEKFNAHKLTERIDILFVAFGHIKQEKWMQRYLPRLNSKIMIGVGGAFDYLSGSVPRAPKWLQNLGLEWLFRLLIQPWRIRRFWKLPYFLYLAYSHKKK